MMHLKRLLHTKKENYVFLLSVLIQLGVICKIKADPSRIHEEFCMDEDYKARCEQPDHVILMRAAKAGRLWMGECITNNRGHIGCSQDILTHMDTSCSGQTECQVAVTKVTRTQTECPSDLKLFLVAEYDCVPVTPCDQARCGMSPPLLLTSPTGYIASSQLATTGCGSRMCPWTIQVPQGQRINLTLYDFTLAMDNSCEQYGFGTIYDGSKQEKITNCLRKRQRVFYKSETNLIKLALSQTYAQNNGFVIKYEAIGCENIEIPEFAEMERRDDNSMSVTCLYSQTAWHLTCDGKAWIGEIGECPGTNINTAKNTGQPSQNSSLGLLFVIGLGVVLGIVIGFVLLCVVAMYMKRKNREQTAKSTYLINDNSQYRDYLSKTGTMFGLYPTNQNAESSVGPDGALIYRPMHDYTSTLHPHQQQNRPLPHHIVEVVSLPPGHTQQDCHALSQEDLSMEGGMMPPQPGVIVTNGGTSTSTSTTNSNPGRHKSPSPHPYTSTKGPNGEMMGNTCGVHTQPGQPREHIYELPNFPDRNRARSADSGLAYSVGLPADQTNHRTT